MRKSYYRLYPGVYVPLVLHEMKRSWFGFGPWVRKSTYADGHYSSREAADRVVKACDGEWV